MVLLSLIVVLSSPAAAPCKEKRLLSREKSLAVSTLNLL
jgi:hypothetical protein